MSRSVALCIDEQSHKNPALIGLEGEVLDAQGWLSVYSDADEARRGIKGQRELDSVWVAASDSVEPINLAATIKAERPELQVSLISGERCGSLCSRARTARIDEVLDLDAFIRRYGEVKLGCHTKCHAKATAILPDPIDRASAASCHGTPRHGRVEADSKDIQASLPMPTSISVARRAVLFTVVSGSGGAGKSSVAAVVALSASRKGQRVLLLDYDLQFGDVAGMVGSDNVLEIDIALDQPERLQRFLEYRTSLSVLSCPERLESAENVVERLPQLIQQVSEHYDLIVANTGAAWAEQHALLLERSSIVLFLIDQRSSSLRACRHALELCARCGIASVPFRFALNRCAKNAPFASVEVSSVLQGAEVFEIKDGGFDVEECLSGGAAGELVDSNNEFVSSIGYMMDVLLPQNAETASFQAIPKEGTGFFKRRGRHGSKRRGR